MTTATDPAVQAAIATTTTNLKKDQAAAKANPTPANLAAVKNLEARLTQLNATNASRTATASAGAGAVAPVATSTTTIPATVRAGTPSGAITSGVNNSLTVATNDLNGASAPTTSVTPPSTTAVSPTTSPLSTGLGSALGQSNPFIAGEQTQSAADLANQETPAAASTTATGATGFLSSPYAKWVIAGVVIVGGVWVYRRSQQGKPILGSAKKRTVPTKGTTGA